MFCRFLNQICWKLLFVNKKRKPEKKFMENLKTRDWSPNQKLISRPTYGSSQKDHLYQYKLRIIRKYKISFVIMINKMFGLSSVKTEYLLLGFKKRTNLKILKNKPLIK